MRMDILPQMWLHQYNCTYHGDISLTDTGRKLKQHNFDASKSGYAGKGETGAITGFWEGTHERFKA